MAGPSICWSTFRTGIGDRSPLFAAIAAAHDVRTALYPGSYVDLAPSTAFPHTTYVDTDDHAARYFADEPLVRSELAERTTYAQHPRVDFVHADYTTDLPIEDGSFDLLISLFAGLVSDACRRYLRPGGLLLANSSHGDASVVALDSSWQLVAAVQTSAGGFELTDVGLRAYLRPKPGRAKTAEEIRRRGTGVAYTQSAFAYLFRLVG
ncbi:MAG: methyltransferase domain-containing protein [Propionibacteriales bacterium]|nr:methyltransferase domain-containing protein [Propionibacteriales bacterium]